MRTSTGSTIAIALGVFIAVLGVRPNAGHSAPVVPSLADYAILRWAGTPDLSVKARFGKGAKAIDGHVCVDILSMRRQTVIGSGSGALSDAVALRTSRSAMRFAKPVTVAEDVVTGGGLIRGQQNVTYGGRIDTSGTGAEITECGNAVGQATAKHAEFANPAIVGTAVGTINGGGPQTILATDPGCNIIDINEIRVRKDGKLEIVGGPQTQSVIIRVATKMHLGRRVEIVPMGGLTPEQILFIVEGPFTSRRDVMIRGTVMGNHPIWIGRGGMVEGQLLSSRKVVMRRFSMITHKPFVDWFGTCGQPTPTPTQTATVPTSTPAPTDTAAPPTDTPTAGPSATDTSTIVPDTATPEPQATDTPLSTATDTPIATETATALATDTPEPTATASATDTATAPATDTPEPTATASATDTATATAATATPTTTPIGARPDLIVSAITNPPASIPVGGSFTVTETVLNQGNGSAGTSVVHYFLSFDAVRSSGDRRLTGFRTVPGPLLPGASSTGTLTVRADEVVAGTYYLLACADATSVVSESIESNNCRASTSTVIVVP